MPTQSWAQKDYYRILGVAETATEEQIKRAYRRLALQHHPDRNPSDPGAGEQFKEISEAYAILVDPAKRRTYSAFRQAQVRHEPFGGRTWSQDDILRDLFTNPRSADLFEELGREFSRLGFRFDDRFFRDTFFGGRGIFFGGVIVFGPFGARRTVFRPGREAMGARERHEVRPEPDLRAIPSVTGFLGWLGRELRAVFSAPAEGVRRLLALAGGRAGRDLTERFKLVPEEARLGGQRPLVIERDGRTEELLVRIPPGVRAGTRLRLRGKGVEGGDLYLKVEISE